ncbi:hypothetical protein A2531_06555 [Candidatus Falkowbacteria bacterium RIFOXYD2_FULL_34_120]|uniref:Uncharacterized protein n=1 Tax=Candidatus Falkowbacteria bacterium RIFOXYD2_FULL_34_120 TaxID=1798007 RepID=A0A1F5TMR7_9BACT|nr:MAG: hypothetical protein A2500_05045 [Candidatus Falkowbacteria bacterium RIFOXYC12_FULL_34_55]OGF38002.1 MAG: hypothetical protein A2466_03755 [Candidatus Falkowbacteria bacterium RIFOXYC2_FULL_34_220]OGF38257.1 MAG: hypothetical protein A2515_00665 [Candidatus Falkowbacteria bacterium RIFOXYD12_FULL_34_57]OGF40176.1 MAG: hypothetical protein A2531_06555 [Candidatus Falkowbacteria bacterium RIFOXYD2_FULL_34_120]
MIDEKFTSAGGSEAHYNLFSRVGSVLHRAESGARFVIIGLSVSMGSHVGEIGQERGYMG